MQLIQLWRGGQISWRTDDREKLAFWRGTWWWFRSSRGDSSNPDFPVKFMLNHCCKKVRTDPHVHQLGYQWRPYLMDQIHQGELWPYGLCFQPTSLVYIFVCRRHTVWVEECIMFCFLECTLLQPKCVKDLHHTIVFQKNSIATWTQSCFFWDLF